MCDSELTVQVGVLDSLQSSDCVLTDKGFCIAAQKRVIVNRQPMASEDQFTSGECDVNLKIVALRIHVERWIGRMRESGILNMVWHTDRLDLLNEVWKFVGHLVNIVSLIGPETEQ